MDKFSYTIFIKTLAEDPLIHTMDKFEEYISTLSKEELLEVHSVLQYPPSTLTQAKHALELEIILWHYQ